MADQAVHTALDYQNKWLHIQELEQDGHEQRVLKKEIQADFINPAESWNREIRLKRALDTIPQLDEAKGSGPSGHEKTYSIPPGSSLLSLIYQNNLPLAERYKIARDLIGICGGLHAKGYIFCDLNPYLFWCDLIEEKTYLLDTIMTVEAKDVSEYYSTIMGIEPDAYCLSPEQSTHTTAIPDFRSNYYSLGAILYALFTGRFPLDSPDRLSLIHKQLSQLPPPPQSLHPELGLALSDFLIKMQAKDPNDRYQSHIGLLHDFEACQALQEKGETQKSLELGSQDFPAEFHLPSHVFFRKEAHDQLLGWSRDLGHEESALVMIEGKEGSGASYFIDSYFKDLDYDRFFVGGGSFSKSDTIPFKGLKECTSDLLQQLLMEDAVVIREIKSNLKDRIGNLAGVLVNFDRSFEFLFDETEVAEELTGTAALNRFTYAYTEFLRTLLDQGKSVVFALENFDLADVGTTHLVQQILKSSVLQHIILILTHEEKLSKPSEHFSEFKASLDSDFMARESIRYNTLQLTEYSTEDLDQILETLKVEPRAECSRILMEKTRGNLTFIRQFFKELIAQDYIRANPQKKIWEVDVSAIQNIDLTDNMREFLGNRIYQLDEEEQKTLKAATAIGQVINLHQLSHILPYKPEHTDELILRLRDKGFLSPLEYSHARLTKMRFSHPLFFDIVTESMPREELEGFKTELIGVMLEELDENLIEVRLYELVAHLMPLSPQKALPHLGILEKAAYKAKNEAAFENACRYFTKLCDIHDIQENADPDRVFEYAYEATLCGLYALKYDRYQTLLRRLYTYVSTDIQRYRIYLIKALETIQRHDYHATLDNLEEGLKDMGVKFKLDISKREIILLFIKSIWISKRLAKKVDRLPHNTGEKVKIYNQLINFSSAAVYFLKPELTARLTYQGLKDTLAQGLISETPYNLIGFGFTLSAFSNMLALAHKISGIAYKLMENKVGDKEVAIPTNFLYYAFVAHTQMPLPDVLDALEDNFKVGRELGNISTAHYSLVMNRWYTVLSGIPLTEVQDIIEASYQLAQDDNQKISIEYHKLIRVLIELLRGDDPEKEQEGEDILALSGLDLDHQSTSNIRILMANVRMIRLIVDGADNIINTDEELLKALLKTVDEGGYSTVNALYHIFYALLHIFRGKQKIPGLGRRKINSYIKIFKTRAKFAPWNYEVKYLLLLAMKAEAAGKTTSADSNFNQAYVRSLEYENLWDKALAAERYGEFLMDQGMRTAAMSKISEAFSHYKNWKATRVTARMLKDYPELADLQAKSSLAGNQALILPAESRGSMEPVLKLSRSVLEEDSLENQMRLLLDSIAMESLVDRVVFLIRNEFDFGIYATKERNEETVIANRSAESYEIPLSLIRLVDRRKKSLVIGNAFANSQYRGDPYIQTQKTKSILCIPFVRKNKARSFIYLENNQYENAFENAQIDLIKLMYSQVAVSIDNAILTEYLEEKLEERSLQIKEEQDKTDALIRNILPQQVAEELKRYGKVKAKGYDNVSVLFTDFKDFTLFSESLRPDQIIDELDRCFSAFDEIVEKYGLEKIKTMGDAYMCAGGLADINAAHEYNITQAGLEMLNYISQTNAEREARNIPPLSLRVGIHAGPLIAGVVGSKKYVYDIWGPTVNIAARMESSGEPGKLNISGTMYLLVKDKYNCAYRGKISAKNVGDIDMYFVHGKI